MSIPIPSLETIEDFLFQKRIAMIGVSRNPKDFVRPFLKSCENGAMRWSR